MADLEKHQNREDWLRWAIEFMRRGLWVDHCITVHGPHEPPHAYMWGSAEAVIDGDQKFIVDCAFTTTRQIRNKYDVRWVRIKDRGNCEKTEFTVLERSKLTPSAHRWLWVAKRTLKRLRADRLRADGKYRGQSRQQS